MSAYTNALDFWKHFEKVQDSLKTSLANKQYDTFNDIVETLDEEVYESIGSHFFVENYYDEFEMTFDTGPNKTTQYLANLYRMTAPKNITSNWIINSHLPPMSQKAIQAQIKIKDDIYTLADFHVFYSIIENTQTLRCQLYCPAFHLISNPENKKEMSMYLIELAIGQCAYEAYMGQIDFVDTPPEDTNLFCNLVDFYEKLDELIVNNQWKEYRSPLEIYSVYQPIKDFAHDSLRKDMKYIFTTNPLLIEDTLENHNDVLNDLESKDGEYGFIYYSNIFHNKEDALYRQNLSKQIDDALAKVCCANVVGGAIGKSFSYIDLIIYDKERFIKAFKEIKKQLKSSVELNYESFKDIID